MLMAKGREFLSSQEVVFLYKLRDGVCPESYGMNVARMAQIPDSIIDTANQVAAEFENTHQLQTQKGSLQLHDVASFHALMNNQSVDRIWLSLQK
jgi:DNA mismatch repair protein MSH6